MFDWTTMTPGAAETFDPQTLIRERSAMWERVEGNRSLHFPSHGSPNPAELILQAGAAFGLNQDPKILASLSLAEIEQITPDQDTAHHAHKRILDAVDQASTILRDHLERRSV